MSIKYTIFTPTYNREKLLPRAYKSLLNQSYKDFVWLIIDDGSQDGTESLVAQWKKDGHLKIEYYKKENGGKYTAMVMAFNMLKTEFCITLDSDDELTKDAVEVFDKCWNDITRQGLKEKIVEIRANSLYADSREVVGNFVLTEKGQTYIDCLWHEFYFKIKATNECLSCHKTHLLKQIFKNDERFWLQGKFKYLQESVFWARLGKLGKMRYLNQPLRLYHTDAPNSIMLKTNPTVGYYNELVSNKYFLSENMEFLRYAPLTYLNHVVKYVLCGYILKIGPKELFYEAKGLCFKLWMIVTLPVSLGALFYFKWIKNKFWRD